MVEELIIASYVRQPMIAHDMAIDKEISMAPRLDETDVRILGYLAEDARLSQRAIARAIGMSPPAVADRIGRLETLGVIKGYRAEVDYALLGRTLTVVVGITSERSDNQRELAQQVLSIPEVEGVDLVTGQDDLRVRLCVRDQRHLNEVYFEQLLTLPGIRHTETTLVLYGFTPDNFAKQVLDSLTTLQEEA
jgi:Lrp/AsnC family transcriptional regulator, leucine-responsive regulatory protein